MLHITFFRESGGGGICSLKNIEYTITHTASLELGTERKGWERMNERVYG